MTASVTVKLLYPPEPSSDNPEPMFHDGAAPFVQRILTADPIAADEPSPGPYRVTLK